MYRHQVAEYQDIQPGDMVGYKKCFFWQRSAKCFCPDAEQAGNGTKPCADDGIADTAGMPGITQEGDGQKNTDDEQQTQQHRSVKFSYG